MAKRSRKLPVALGQGAAPDFTVSEASWQKIESAYGDRLSESVRTAILEATRIFVSLERFERTAEPIANAEKAIEGNKHAAARFRHVMLSAQSDADVFARHLIIKHFQDRRFFSLVHLLGSFQSACDRARVDLDNIPAKAPEVTLADWLLGNFGEAPSIEKGRAWRQWIQRLTEVMKGAGLSWKARKDAGGKSKSDRPSDFVLFVRELQYCLPDGCDCPTHSDGALAVAISRARFKSGHKKPRSASE